MKENHETYCVFDYRINSIQFEIFYDIGVVPNRLGFLPLHDERQLWLEITKGFNLDSNMSKDDYYLLVDILGIKKNPDNKFIPASFFREFNDKIPTKYKNLEQGNRQNLIRKIYSVEEEEKTIFDGVIDWDKLRSNKSRSHQNLEKTRLLYPELYERIKNRNISVRYKVPD